VVVHVSNRRHGLATFLQSQLSMFESVGAPAPSGRLSKYSWIVSAVGLLAFGGWLVYITASEVVLLTRGLPPTPPEVTSDIVVRNVQDTLGRRASFRILLFTDEFRWRLNSYDSLDTRSARPVFTSEMKAVLSEASEIICVGASSEEIPAGVSFEIGRAAEERRAARRADQIALWVREAVARPIPIRKLNVGHHMLTTRGGDTSDQRRVVIILVLDHDQNTNLDQALRAAMAAESTRAPIFEALLTRYSLAAGRAFTWVP
jgi:hypothetical protein